MRAISRLGDTERRSMGLALAMGALLAGAPDAHGQLAEPCGTRCALTLGATSVVFASGTSAAIGRISGGFSTKQRAVVVWTAGFTASAAAGIALSGNGERQRRAVHSAALGALGGSLAGLAAESLVGESSAATRVAATLIGAAIGVAAGGAIGALTYEADAVAVATYTRVGPTWSIPIGFRVTGPA